jgi:hypothetical protein
MNTCTIFKIIIHNSIRIYYTTKTYIINKLRFIWSTPDSHDYDTIKYNADEDSISYALYTNPRNRSPLDIIEEQPVKINIEENNDETKEEPVDEDDDDYSIEQNQWDII